MPSLPIIVVVVIVSYSRNSLVIAAVVRFVCLLHANRANSSVPCAPWLMRHYIICAERFLLTDGPFPIAARRMPVGPLLCVVTVWMMFCI